MSSIAVSKVVKTTTDDKDSYDVLMKGQMRFDGTDETFHPDDDLVPYSEMADIELKIKGIDQRKLLIDNKIFRIGAVKALTLQDIQTTISDFKAHDPYKSSYQMHGCSLPGTVRRKPDVVRRLRSLARTGESLMRLMTNRAKLTRYRRDDLMQIEIGKRYRNKHTLAECVVRQKWFFNIQYYEDGDDPEERDPKYCHYKRFQKYWEEVI